MWLIKNPSRVLTACTSALMLVLSGLCLPLAAAQLSDQDEFFIQEINLVGNTVLDEAELAHLIEPYVNRPLTLAHIQTLRESITRRYIELGYINSGAMIPDQDIGDGILEINIVEGRLSQVNVTGHKRLQTTYFTEQLLNDWRVLNIADLQKKIQALHSDPLIEKVDAELRPGSRRGEGILDITVHEVRPYRVELGINNHRSPSVGEYRVEIAGVHENLTGHADKLAAKFGYTEGLKDVALEYAIPINRSKTTVSAGGDYSESEVIEEPFNTIGIQSETERYFVGITHPFYTRPNGYFTGSLTFEQRQSRSYLLGELQQLSPGAIGGKARVTVIRLGNEWLLKSENQVLALRSRFSFGLDAGGATINGKDAQGRDIPDGRFRSWLGQLQWIQRLDWKNSLVVVDASLHHTSDPLLSMEKFGLGGVDTVRGYRENVLVRDKTVNLSLEYRLPIFGPRWQLVSFYDYGYGTNVNDESDIHRLSSVGLGLRWIDTSGHYRGELYWAEPRDDVVTLEDDNSLQDKGIHLSLDASF